MGGAGGNNERLLLRAIARLAVIVGYHYDGKHGETLRDKTKCCGCGACFNACPTRCIEMLPDEEGFLYPFAEQTACTKCDVCVHVCPMKTSLHRQNDHARCLGVKVTDEGVRRQSTSGGLFTLLSDYVISATGGFVYGAAFDEHHNLTHIETADKKGRDRMRDAKYIQSDLNDVFHKVKTRLKEGHSVLFTGTPCQVHGLRLFLGRDYERLLCVDNVCNGVPSPGVWHDYFTCLQKNGIVTQFKSRDKRNGWHNSTVSYMQNGKIHYEAHGENLFTGLYFRGAITRPCCEICPYAGFNRPGDITMGDFWGIEKVNPDFDDGRGVSLAILHNQKAIDIFERVKHQCTYFECSKEDMLQPRLETPPPPSPDRTRFFKTYKKHGTQYIARLMWSQRQKWYLRRFHRRLKDVLRPRLARQQERLLP
ncbi:MAG: Coenzyme F420 hydrogenase/dehydrogenase, beta subunit C-terminal domain [Halobacteriota archaeon]